MGWSPFHVLAVLSAAAVLSSAKNVTIDDTDLTHWSYTGPWGTISKTNLCSACQTQPDPNQVYDGTWHDLSQIGSATLSASAQAIQIFAICPGTTVDGGHYRLNLSILLDGKEVAEFQSPVGGCSDYEYNYLIYSVSDIALQDHSVQIMNHIQDTAKPDSDLLIDYAIIDDGTAATSSSSSSSATSQASSTAAASHESSSSEKSSVPILAIAIPVVIVVLAGLLLAFWLWRRRRQRTSDAPVPVPFGQDMDSGSYGADMRSVHSSAYAARSQYGGDNFDGHSLAPTNAPASHDAQLEAALAIIADRAARVQQDTTSPTFQPAPSAAYEQARRPEKSRYRANSNSHSQGATSLQRSASIAPSGSSGSHYVATEVGTDFHQPPSYVESTVVPPLRR